MNSPAGYCFARTGKSALRTRAKCFARADKVLCACIQIY